MHHTTNILPTRGTSKNIPSIANPISEIKGDPLFLFSKRNIILLLLKVIHTFTSMHPGTQKANGQDTPIALTSPIRW
jgi:hypothetical protein